MTKKKVLKRIGIIFLFFFILMIFSFPSYLTLGSDEYASQSLTGVPQLLHEAPSIAIYGNSVHVVWNTYLDEFTTKIYYKRSLDNGNTWDNATILTQDSIQAVYPVVGVNKNLVHVVWKDYSNGNPEIYYARSIDNGDNWSLPKQLTFNSSRETDIYDINLAVDGDNLYMVWKDYRTGSSEIFFKKSTDGGVTWFDDQRLTFDYKASYAPTLAVQNNNIYVAYEDWGDRSNICFLKSENFGNNWSAGVFLTDNKLSGDSKSPDLAVEKDHIYLAWQDDRTSKSELYFRKSGDGGDNWNEEKELTYNSTSAINPRIYVYGSSIMLIWQDMQDSLFNIYYKTSSDGGESWSENKALITDTDCYDIEIAGDKDNIGIVWQNYHEASWSDIWYLNNLVITNNNTQKDTPGFEIGLFIIILAIFTLYKKVNKRR